MTHEYISKSIAALDTFRGKINSRLNESVIKSPKIFRSSFDAKLWLNEEFEPFASVHSWDETEKVANVKTLLETKMLKEYLRVPGHEHHTWPEFVEWLQLNYRGYPS